MAHTPPHRPSVKARLSATTSLVRIASLIAIGIPALAHADALPSGGRVAAGSAVIASSASATTITQTSQNAVINWDSFSVGLGNVVAFHQPDASAATLNRVTGSATSTIAGQITSNGAVYLVNPNGIAITGTGAVQTGGGFIASTLDIADADFMAGRLNFSGHGSSKTVSNAGSINAGDGAYVALLGGAVANAGTITVPLGKVGLGSGESVALDLNGGGFMQVAVPTALVTGSNALVDNSGTITVIGGRVTLSAAAVKDAVRDIIKVSGSINADSAVSDGGTITLIGGADTAHMAGTVTVSGSLSATATGASGNGGQIETSGAAVAFTGAKVDTSAAHGRTGTWLVDPTDLTVDAAAAATIASDLATTNVTLKTTATAPTITGTTATGVQTSGAGDIIVNSGISFASANTLTLDAYHAITINAPITVSGAGGVALTTNDGGSGGALSFGNAATLSFTSASQNGSLSINGTATTLIYTMAQLDAIDGQNAGAGGGTLTTYGAGIAGSYALATNLDAAGTTYVRPLIGGGSGAITFSGAFEGLGHTLSNLTIAVPSGVDQQLRPDRGQRERNRHRRHCSSRRRGRRLGRPPERRNDQPCFRLDGGHGLFAGHCSWCEH